jgi:hypothetical protein
MRGSSHGSEPRNQHRLFLQQLSLVMASGLGVFKQCVTPVFQAGEYDRSLSPGYV